MVKRKKKDLDVGDLFRQKLGNAELIPDPSVSSILMRKLALREFIRFNPARINIYCVGAVLVTAIAVALVISYRIDKSQSMVPDNAPLVSIQTESDGNGLVTTSEPYIKESDDQGKRNAESLTSNDKNKKHPVDSKQVKDQRTEGADNHFVVTSNVRDSFSKRGIFTVPSPDINKLHERQGNEVLLFEPSVLEGCSPLKLRFKILSQSYDSCRWIFGDGGYSNVRDPEWIFDIEGDYKVVLILFGSNGSQTVSSTNIKVYPSPVAHFEISPEKVIIPDDEIHFQNYSTNASEYIWDFGDGRTSDLFEPVYLYSKYGNYNVSLVVTSQHGCKDSVSIVNAFSGSQYYIDFPNAFIPNEQGPLGGYYSSKSDEAAQIFHPSYTGVSSYQLKIFSKLGILIFESNDINIGWDGYFKGQLCEPGVYIWKVRGNFRNGEPFTKMGDVTILRN